MNCSKFSKFGSAALAAVFIAAASPAFGQSTLDHLVVNAPNAPVTVHITQDGAAKLGTATDPITLVGASTGAISLTVEQIGASGTQASLVKAYTTGTLANTITLKQETADATPGAVNDVWAKILLGTAGAPAANQHVTLLQRGDKAQATITSVGDNLSAYIIQQGSNSGVSSLIITNDGANNIYGTAGSPVTLGALSTLNLSNTGAGNTYAVALAAGSTASITNTGNSNTYNIASQQAGDSASLVINGSNNAFNFDFSTTYGSGARQGSCRPFHAASGCLS